MQRETQDRLTYVCGFLRGVAEAIDDDTRNVVATRDHIEIIKHFAALRIANDQIKEAREALEELEKRLSREYIPEVMRAHGIKTVTIEDVGRVSLSNRWSCSMIDKPLGLDYLRNSGNGSLIQETVNSNTLAAFAKNFNDEEGKELPGEIFKTSIMTVTSITKA